MKVVHINTTDRGGAAIAAIQIHQALLGMGVDSQLLTMERSRGDVPRHTRVPAFGLAGPAWLERTAFKARRLLERLHLVEDRTNQPDNRYLQDRPPGHALFTLPYSWFSILDHPEVQQADVLHLHWVSFGMVDPRDLFTHWKKPVVWTLHDMNPFTGGCHYADGCEGFKTHCPNCPQLRYPDKVMQYHAYKRNALAAAYPAQLRLVAPSQWLADLAMASTVMQGHHCAVIPNGFDTSVFAPQDRAAARAELGLPNDRKVVLFNALDVDDPRKGMPQLLEALLGMQDEPIHLVCIGGRGALLPDALEVTYTGFVHNPHDLARYYAAADLFVLPSLADNLPNTVCEALLCGTPVVAFAVGGIPEQVDGSNGALAPANDADALREAIRSVLATPWDRDRIAQHAREKYASTRAASAYLELYAP